LNRAFEVLSDERRLKNVTPARLVAIMREISLASGVFAW